MSTSREAGIDAPAPGLPAMGRMIDRSRRYRLNEVCALAGLSARRVREYERLGLLGGVSRTNGGQRAYGDAQIERLRLIVRLRHARMSIADIRLTVQVLGGHGLGVDVEAVRRMRALLAVMRGEIAATDEIAQALEQRLTRTGGSLPADSSGSAA